MLTMVPLTAMATVNAIIFWRYSAKRLQQPRHHPKTCQLQRSALLQLMLPAQARDLQHQHQRLPAHTTTISSTSSTRLHPHSSLAHSQARLHLQHLLCSQHSVLQSHGLPLRHQSSHTRHRTRSSISSRSPHTATSTVPPWTRPSRLSTWAPRTQCAMAPGR